MLQHPGRVVSACRTGRFRGISLRGSKAFCEGELDLVSDGAAVGQRVPDPAGSPYARPMAPIVETRRYFVISDLLSNVAVGALVGAITAALFGPAWNMFIAMLVAMVLGMAISLPFAFLFGALFGAMEIMVPVMTTGMVSGMVVSMTAAMGTVSAGRGAQAGAVAGVGVIAAVYLANAVIRTRTSHWMS